MKKNLFVIFAIIFSVLSLQLNAQSEGKKFSFGFGFQGGLPLGNIKDEFSFIGGLDFRFSYKAGPGFATLSLGGDVFAPKTVNGSKPKADIQIPILVGYKYKIVPHFFVMGEVGYSSFRSYYQDPYTSQLTHATSSGFTYAPSIGTEFGAFELAARYEGVSITGGTISYVALRLGFNF
jgi:hypothetical protein